MTARTLGELFSRHHKRLGIRHRGHGPDSDIRTATIRRWGPGGTYPAGSIVIMQPGELRVLASPPETANNSACLKDWNSSVGIVCDGYAPSARERRLFAGRGLGLLTSQFDEHLLESRLVGVLSEERDGVRLAHATLVQIEGKGVLLTGGAGAGKTSLALALVGRGGRWVADDTVVLERTARGTIKGRAHAATRGLLHLRGRGIVRLGDCAPGARAAEEVRIDLVAELTGARKRMGSADASGDDTLGVPVPHVRLGAGAAHPSLLCDAIETLCRRPRR